MKDIQVWVLTSAVIVMGSILGWIGSSWWKSQKELLQGILDQLTKLNENNVAHSKDIDQLREDVDDHEERIRYIEQHKRLPKENL